MNRERKELSIETARLYYLLDYTQQDIAKKLKVSRPTVSRLLQYAKANGFVNITITDPYSDISRLEKLLKERYNLLEVHVAFSPSTEYTDIIKYLSNLAAEYLMETVSEHDIIGIGWGNTMYQIAKKIQRVNVKNVEVVQLKGGISYSSSNTYAYETLTLFAKAFNATGHSLPLPVIFDNVEVKRLVEHDRHIRYIIELGEKANIAVFTVGAINNEALLFNLGYFNDEEKVLLKKESVGDICSRFFDADGKISSPIINDRTIGIDLDELRKKKKSILIAGGDRKIEAINGALNGKYANILITDQYSAKSLLGIR